VFGEGEGGFSGWSNVKPHRQADGGARHGRRTFHDFRTGFDTNAVVDSDLLTPSNAPIPC
jgi:hypothetical protein